MDTSVLKSFAQESRRYLMDVVKKKIDYYLTQDNVDIRAKKSLIDDLKKEINDTSEDQVIEKIAYTWFNRFCALRYMDVKQYSVLGVLTPARAEHTQPEILMEAKSGHIKDELGRKETKDQVIALLSGKASSSDPQNDAYKLLLLMSCNYYHSIMPFLFEKIDDYTELLMPDDLLSESSIISKTRQALSAENCENVEVIGWLYQFYISEKKDEVFAGLKNNKKITPENIPAATQLFTPNWIVRYLVENSLGRLWMLNRPNSNLISKMEYYIKPETVENDFLKIKGPEEIKICDPACGSGHMLVYAFDLLYLMYEEEGIDPNEIPSLILKNNLFGIEIDQRAGELAAFALTIKAREKQRRYFRNPVQPNICVLENIQFDTNEIKDYMDHIGRDLFTEQFKNTLCQFEEAKNFGSLIRPELTDVDSFLSLLDKKNVSGHLLLSHTHSKVLHLLIQVKFLSPVYHVVIANPPYMGGKGMNGRLGAWLKENYSDVKSDLFSAFMVRNAELALTKGQLGFMTPFVWMFISSYEKLRSFLIDKKTITSLVQLEYSGFDGATVPICTFTLENYHKLDFKGGYVRLADFRGSENQAPKTLEAIENPRCGWFYRASASDFKNIPGGPIAFWVAPKIFKIFSTTKPLGFYNTSRNGMTTGENAKFVRIWHELSLNKIGFNFENSEKAKASHMKWFPYNKGGDFRKYFGNCEYVVDWENDGERLKLFERSILRNQSYYFRPGVTWTLLSSSYFGSRIIDPGFLFDVNGMTMFCSPQMSAQVSLGFLTSRVCREFLKILNPTLAFQVGDIERLPVDENAFNKIKNEVSSLISTCIQITRDDWNSRETAWDFTELEILTAVYRNSTLKNSYTSLRKHWNELTQELCRLESKNNELFIGAFELGDQFLPDTYVEEITLYANPYYRYGGEKTELELEKLLLSDTLREFISYSVGCMFGRYSLDKEGLILANQGETIKDYLKQVPKPTFSPDEDNVIPVLDGDWFADEISERFKSFLKVTFGEKNFEENLKFLEEAIGKDIRKYFAKDFYNDHVKMYRKRPIYWMFSSPNGTFNALIYMHRYTPDTVSIVLNNYLREFRTKLNSKRENLERLFGDASASTRDKASALKEIEQLKKMITELNEYEKDILYPLATQRIEIDLDDGVKVNYPKFGKALKNIKGLDKDEE
ncbi:MAG: BREX-1 system adenine-specific DNA-methyltransferase PglX [Bdellovibrionaceae bacterium]|nr:BREX-1 system adenine-specific DNA-methyltransferase PglX [Pseudobdellovibrionaceae bacterium]